MASQTELDPIEKMMIARMADFFISNSCCGGNPREPYINHNHV